MSSKSLCAAIAVTASLLLVTPTANAATEMSQDRAGRYYLRYACQVNDAGKRFDRAMFRGKRSVHVSELTGRRLRQVKRAARALSNAYYTSVRRYRNPPAAWPSDVRWPVRRLTQFGLTNAGIYSRLSHATNGRQVLRRWDRAQDAHARQGGRVPRVIRAQLDLPAPGRGCGR